MRGEEVVERSYCGHTSGVVGPAGRGKVGQGERFASAGVDGKLILWSMENW